MRELDAERLSAHGIGEAASRVAVIPGLRSALREKQRGFATTPPGAVLDGRDIGTVVFPDAAAKLYVTASPEARARRRTLEIRERGTHIDEAEVLADIRRRDARDDKRARFAAAAGSRRLLARHHRFGYRSRVPGGRRLCEPQDGQPPIGAPLRVRPFVVRGPPASEL